MEAIFHYWNNKKKNTKLCVELYCIKDKVKEDIQIGNM